MQASIHRTALAAALALASSAAARAQDGFYDTAWLADGRGLYDFGQGRGSLGSSIAAQSDGKLILGGDCARESGPMGICVARLLPNGQSDVGNFNVNGYMVLGNYPSFPPGNQQIALHGLAVQRDNRIVLASQGWVPGSTRNESRLTRLTPDGLFQRLADDTFFRDVRFQDVDPAVADTVANAVAIAPDGKIVVAGGNIFYNESTGVYLDSDMGVARFNADMTPDTGFNNRGFQFVAFDQGGDNRDIANAVAVQPDGKIVLAGVARSGDGSTNNDAALVRLNVDGSLDTSFGNGGMATLPPIPRSGGSIVISGVNAVAIDRSGGILIAGSVLRFDLPGTNLIEDMFVARFLPNGTLDIGFGPHNDSPSGLHILRWRNGTIERSRAYGLLLQGDAQILVYGSTDTDDQTIPSSMWAMSRIYPWSGWLDTSFSDHGYSYGTYSQPGGVSVRNNDARGAVIADGGLFITGRAFDYPGGEDFIGVAKLTLDAIFKDDFYRH